MAIESKEIIMNVRKGVMFSIRITYRSACAHPYISGLLCLLLVLYRGFPSLFAFLISYSPVIVCTAILLGTLLSYGRPNIPEIEDNKKTREISSLQTVSVVDDIVMKKDESFTVKTNPETDMEVNERAVNEAVGEASNSASTEIERHGEGNRKNNTVLATSLLLQEDRKEMHNEMKVMDEREVADCGFVEDREFSVENQAELALELDADVRSVAVNDPNEFEDLTAQIAKTASDSPFGSSLSSIWRPVDTSVASSGSDSDGADSSPDASMADIIPMLDELHPPLDFEHPQPTLIATDNSDAASSGLSQDHESEEGIAEVEIGNKEDTDKESQEKDDANEVAIQWTADDQKCVMDLGYSEVERNRRLENLIARRKLRKLQRFETEKNLFDLNSYYSSSIPSISAPRKNPFDPPQNSDGNLNLSPFPGSAPSVLQPRQNPFDLHSDQVREVNTLSREYLSHHDFISSSQRRTPSRRHESSTTRPSFSGDPNIEKKGSKLNPYFAAERADSEETRFAAFERQFTGQEDHKELIEPEIHQESIMLSPISHAVEHVEQDRQSLEAADSIDNKRKWSGMDVNTDSAIDFNTSTNIEETHQAANAFGVMEEEIGEVEDNLPFSDTGKLEVIKKRYEDSNSSSSDEKERISEVHINEESDNPEEMRDESVQSDWVNGAQTAAIGKPLSNISIPDEALLYEGTENFISNSLPSDVQADFSELASPPRPFQANLSSEDRNLVVVRSGEDLTSGKGELLVESSVLSVVDENESIMREITEIKEHDSIQVGISETSGDVVHPLVAVTPESAAAAQIMHSSSSPTVDSELSESGENHSVDVDKSIKSEENDVINEPPSIDESVIHLSPEADVEESQVIILDLPSNPENLEYFNLEEEHRNVIHPPASSGLNALQVVEDSNVRMFDIELEPSISQKVPEEIGEDELATGLVPEGKNGDASGESSMVPTHDGTFPGSNILGLMESMEFSTQLEMKSDHETGFNNDLSDSQSKIIDEILNNQEGGFLKILNNSDKESDDEVHSEVSGIKGIDESLLSELDALGDFRVEIEPKSDQRGSNLDVAEDPEMNVYSSKLHVLEACSVDELDSVFKQDHEEAVVPPASKSEQVRELGIANSTELPIVEAKSVEDISSAHMQLSEGLGKSSISEVEIAEVLSERTHLGAEEISSDLHVVEAKSIEDINLALQQSKVTAENPPEQMKHEDGRTEVEASERHFEKEVFDVQSSDSNERHLEPEQIEVQSE